MTRYASMTDFDVSGWRVVIGRKTETWMMEANGSETNPNDSTRLYLGEMIEVYGSEQAKTHSIKAEVVKVYQPVARQVEGLAVIDAMLPGVDRTVSADGYRIRIKAETQTKFVKPFNSTADIGTNVVMKYKGVLQPSGVVMAESATFYKNVISNSMLNKRDEWDYDPETIPADSRQSDWSKNFRGVNAGYFHFIRTRKCSRVSAK